MENSSNQYALAALKERRAEIDGQLRECEAKLRHLRESLTHIDATLRLFDPDADPKSIPPKKPYKRVKLFGNGKLSRLVVEALRRGERPMSQAEVLASVVQAVGYGEGASKGMRQRVRANLLYQSKTGAVVKEGLRETARWRLND